MRNAQLENVSRHRSTGWAWFTSCLTEREWVRKRKWTFISPAMINTWLPLQRQCSGNAPSIVFCAKSLLPLRNERAVGKDTSQRAASEEGSTWLLPGLKYPRGKAQRDNTP